MPMHPAAPEDLHGLVEAYAQTTRAVVDLGHSCSEADFTLQTECPGWTVHDQIAHVAGVESMLEGHRDPEVELPDYDHLGNELSHLTERAVEVRRNRRSQDVVSELRARPRSAAVQPAQPGPERRQHHPRPVRPGRGGDGGDDAHLRHLGPRAGHPQRHRPPG